MKKSIWHGIMVLSIVLFSCDMYKHDASITASGKVNFISQKQVLVSLKSTLNLPDVEKFEVVSGPSAGKTEIILDKFMIYTPGNQATESATLKLYDKNGAVLGSGKIIFEERQNSCGIIPFTYAEITQDSSLRVHLADNDLVCAPIHSAAIANVSVENSEGFDISVYVAGTLPESSLDIIYNPPTGFVGTSKSIYVAGLNVKPEYLHQFDAGDIRMNSADDIINNSYIFQNFIVSMAEIKVK